MFTHIQGLLCPLQLPASTPKGPLGGLHAGLLPLKPPELHLKVEDVLLPDMSEGAWEEGASYHIIRLAFYAQNRQCQLHINFN